MTELNILLTCVGGEQSPALINQVYKISKKEHLNVKIIGIDNLNKYYDVKLKLNRLKRMT